MGGDETQEDQVAFFAQLDLLHFDQRAFFFGIVVGELAEIVAAGQVFERGLHLFGVERRFDPPDVVFAEGRTASGELVDVASQLGVVAGVETGRRRLHLDDVHRSGQAVVQGVLDGDRLVTAGETQVRHLRQRVHSGIRAAGAADLDQRQVGVFDRAVKLTHHRAGILLILPAGKPRAVVFDRQLVAAGSFGFGASRRSRRWPRAGAEAPFVFAGERGSAEFCRPCLGRAPRPFSSGIPAAICHTPEDDTN